MLKSFIKLSNQEIEAILNCGKNKKNRKNFFEELNLTLTDRERIIELTQILNELEICSDMLQGDGVSISKVLPSLQTVIHKIDLRVNHERQVDLSNGLITSIK
ncbi:hypothetical protein BpHYR1_024199 [Brachionus plicatilis]|uniref:Uncharacterized protein n=1 Tax=Brachionus plicatilis TaxID=10195 RepID=A0A3M7SJ95_BRAPC|nr:hypothetical protein BpHYR1_024199 [Brachionus plicatilis]